MKRILFFIIFSLASIPVTAQSQAGAPLQNISADNDLVYRLFATRNIYTFIKLDTRNGQMWQIQWSTEDKSRFVSTLSDISRVNKDQEKNGRFFLYPTTNIYTFILLDQFDGRTWQVQWGNQEDRAVIPIY
jgi:hypothetical protein